MSGISTPFPQSTHQQPEDNAKRQLKRTRAKNVAWPTQEKMLQVCLFVAEDAPALLGSVPQDLLEAKKAKLMHTSSANNSPSGLEGAATKRAKLDTVAIAAMVARVEWNCPEQFSYHPLWLVAVGEESSEVSAQHHREVRTLEAFYPRISAIPASSMEPPEAPSDLEHSHPAQIPLISSEDDEEEPGVDAHLEGKEVAVKTNKFNLNLSPDSYAPSKNVENSDPDIAAAAAAAFAVLKAQESGTLIDHELLIKILSNPLLMEAFKASNISARNRREDAPPLLSKKKTDNGNDFMMKLDSLDKGTPMGAPGSLSSHIPQERERYGISEVRAFSPGNPMRQPCALLNGGLSQDRAALWKQGKGILEHGKGALGIISSREQFNPLLGKDIPRKPSPSSGVMSNDSLSQSRPTPMAVKAANALERARPITGPNRQSSLEGILDPPPLAVSGKISAVRDKLPVAKVKRHCFFFNTPKGCRNGIYCNFLHDSPHVEPMSEKINQADVAQQIKNSGGTIADKEVSGESAQ